MTIVTNDGTIGFFVMTGRSAAVVGESNLPEMRDAPAPVVQRRAERKKTRSNKLKPACKAKCHAETVL
jgi:hypothetical protein